VGVAVGVRGGRGGGKQYAVTGFDQHLMCGPGCTLQACHLSLNVVGGRGWGWRWGWGVGGVGGGKQYAVTGFDQHLMCGPGCILQACHLSLCV
jgi:hypothetical protein